MADIPDEKEGMNVRTEDTTIDEDEDGTIELATEDFDDEDNDSDKGKQHKSLAKNTDAKTRPKSKSQVGVRYPTQYMLVGEIHCIFLSCWNRGRSPFLSLGPSWPFTLFLLLLAALILGYFYMML